jgi:hypothetical protein
VFAGGIEPKMEDGEIKENSAARRKAQRAIHHTKIEEQEAALADWESR